MDRADATVPLVDHVVHGVAVGLDLQGAELAVQGEVGEVHGAGGLYSVFSTRCRVLFRGVATPAILFHKQPKPPTKG